MLGICIACASIAVAASVMMFAEVSVIISLAISVSWAWPIPASMFVADEFNTWITLCNAANCAATGR